MGPWQMGSLTGAVASQRVTEALKGTLRMVGNHSSSVNAEECLTARQTGRAGTKVGISDPAVQKVWHLDVGSSHPGGEFASKGWAVRPLKRYASWVQNVVRQFGPYLLWALEV